MTYDPYEDLRRRWILLSVAYDGTDFSGWQIQPKVRTVQGVIQEALSEMEGCPAKIRGAGRTDAGVHARGQAASFKTHSTIPCLGYLRGLNSKLPSDVAVLSAREAPYEFDARRWPCVKIYRYEIYTGSVRDPFLYRYSWHARIALDVDLMQEAALVLLGRHDFSAFRASDCERINPVREIRRIEAKRNGALIRIEVEGPAFLKYMVRIIVGTLVQVGMGKMSARDVEQALISKDRTLAGPTAPACGLLLVTVSYPDLEEQDPRSRTEPG